MRPEETASDIRPFGATTLVRQRRVRPASYSGERPPMVIVMERNSTNEDEYRSGDAGDTTFSNDGNVLPGQRVRSVDAACVQCVPWLPFRSGIETTRVWLQAWPARLYGGGVPCSFHVWL